MVGQLIVALLFSIATSTSLYTVQSIEENLNGFSGKLVFDSQEDVVNEEVITLLAFNITTFPNTFHLHITDANSSRWEVPIILNHGTATSDPSYTINLAPEGSPFALKVTRKSDNFVLFNLDQTIAPFQFNNRDIKISSSLGEDVGFFGWGERVSTFKLNQGTYTTFARDQGDPYDSGSTPGHQVYGVHPFYLALASSGKATGGLFFNTNAMETVFGSNSINIRVIGGVIDYYIFTGDTPTKVTQQYHSLIGKPILVPYWGLGWHQCRWGYHNLSEVETVVEKYNENNIPLDAMWTDIDYMDKYYDWTTDPERYPQAEFKEFIDTKLHAKGKHYIPIVDAGVAKQDYFGYNEGKEANVFIPSPNVPGQPFTGKVWPGPAVFVDYFHPNATSYWVNQFQNFHESIPYDGIWLDMNEASNFCNAECGYKPTIDNLPYTPGGVDLNTKAIDLGAKHYNGEIEYNTHSLFGLMESLATNKLFTEKQNRRAFIISRSSFVTHGQHASHWLGDNFSSFDYMAWSIPGIFDFQLYGIPVVGADICGFNGSTWEELCTRWMQLGTLYPFSRNHNSIHMPSQEPYAFGKTLLNASVKGIRLRYSLFNYLYTLMFDASLFGGMIWKPAFFLFPEDTQLHETHSEDNFLIGDALIVHPCLTQYASTVDAYFPDDLWFNFHTGKYQSPGMSTLSATLEDPINVHIRGGSIIPLLNSSSTAMSSTELRSSNITVLIAPNSNGAASGFMYLDDGLSVDTISSENFNRVQYDWYYDGKTKHTYQQVSTGGFTRASNEWPYVTSLKIFGCLNKPTKVSNPDGSSYPATVEYFESIQVAVIILEATPTPDDELSIDVYF